MEGGLFLDVVVQQCDKRFPSPRADLQPGGLRLWPAWPSYTARYSVAPIAKLSRTVAVLLQQLFCSTDSLDPEYHSAEGYYNHYIIYDSTWNTRCCQVQFLPSPLTECRHKLTQHTCWHGTICDNRGFLCKGTGLLLMQIKLTLLLLYFLRAYHDYWQMMERSEWSGVPGESHDEV